VGGLPADQPSGEAARGRRPISPWQTVGNWPLYLAFDGSSIWVANNSGVTTVQKLRVSDMAIVATASVGGAPTGIAFDGVNMWAGTAANTLVKFRTSDGAVLATTPSERLVPTRHRLRWRFRPPPVVVISHNDPETYHRTVAAFRNLTSVLAPVPKPTLLTPSKAMPEARRQRLAVATIAMSLHAQFLHGSELRCLLATQIVAAVESHIPAASCLRSARRKLPPATGCFATWLVCGQAAHTFAFPSNASVPFGLA